MRTRCRYATQGTLRRVPRKRTCLTGHEGPAPRNNVGRAPSLFHCPKRPMSVRKGICGPCSQQNRVKYFSILSSLLSTIPELTCFSNQGLFYQCGRYVCDRCSSSGASSVCPTCTSKAASDSHPPPALTGIGIRRPHGAFLPANSETPPCRPLSHLMRGPSLLQGPSSPTYYRELWPSKHLLLCSSLWHVIPRVFDNKRSAAARMEHPSNCQVMAPAEPFWQLLTPSPDRSVN